MERTNNPKLPLWRKITPGALYPFPGKTNRRVKFKEEIRISEKDLGTRVDQFELVEDGKGEYKVSSKAKGEEQEKEEQPEPQPKQSAEIDSYTIEHVGAGWYNVVSSDGKVMNEKKLRSEEAKELKASLEEETVEP